MTLFLRAILDHDSCTVGPEIESTNPLAMVCARITFSQLSSRGFHWKNPIFPPSPFVFLRTAEKVLLGSSESDRYMSLKSQPCLAAEFGLDNYIADVWLPRFFKDLFHENHQVSGDAAPALKLISRVPPQNRRLPALPTSKGSKRRCSRDLKCI
ncbi:hypothetical protein BD779DRAFT_1530080 [Infundibulicybe gibba]|nr:hypothetical protein BD779DRAFT_1530080 [Infundibulicybe gibba]